MSVSLPMYDVPELIEAHEIFWSGLRRHLAAVGFTDLPLQLGWPDDLSAAWLDPALLLSQTCGYPLRRQLAGRVQLVGVPCYDALGCSGFRYSSALIVAADSPFQNLAHLVGKTAAYNELGSQSGYNALRHSVAPLARNGRFFGHVIESGRHEHSIDFVREGKADIAAIDGVTLALLQRHQPSRIAGVRIIGQTAMVAGLPFITALSRPPSDVQRLQAALRQAFADPALTEVRAALLLADCAFPDPSVYDDIDRLEHEATNLGYPALA
jgi:ABC-type phosphate/phosphonate transport system substrate-binding protein